MGPRVIATRELISGNPANSETRPLGVALWRKGYRESVHGDDENLSCALSCDEYAGMWPVGLATAGCIGYAESVEGAWWKQIRRSKNPRACA